MKLDFSKFKKVACDGNCTTMEHPDGHTIKIAHKQVSTKMRSELEALPLHKSKTKPKERAKKMADGGEVEENKKKKDENKPDPGSATDRAFRSIRGAFGNEDKKDEKKQNNYNQGGYYAEGGEVKEEEEDKNKPEPGSSTDKAFSSIRSAFGNPPKNYADGGMPLPDQKSPIVINVGGMPQAPNMQAEPQQDIMAQAVDPALQQKRDLYNQMITGNVGPDAVNNMQGMTFGANGEMPNKLNPDLWNQAEQTYEQQKSQESEAANAKVAAEAAENQARARAGMPSLSSSGVAPAASEPPQAEEPAASPVSAPAEAPKASDANQANMSAAFNEQRQGILAEAGAKAELGNQQEKIYQDSINDQASTLNDYKQKVEGLENERQAFIHDLENSHINPDNYWKNHDKLLSGIGIILAGFNPTSRPNAAIEFLNDQMNRDLDAQKAEIGRKENLLTANYRAFGNLNDAIGMTRVMQAEILSKQINQSVAKSQSPTAKAQAMQMLGQLDMKKAEEMQKIAIRQTISNFSNAIGRDSNKANSFFNAIEQVDPEKAKEMRGRYVPGLGMANTSEDAMKVKELKSTIDNAKAGINELRVISGKPFKSIDLQDRAQADVIAQSLVGLLRAPLTGPGAMSEGERNMLQGIIANPTRIFGLDSTTKVKLDTLARRLDSSLVSEARARGVDMGNIGQIKESAPVLKK